MNFNSATKNPLKGVNIKIYFHYLSTENESSEKKLEKLMKTVCIKFKLMFQVF